MDTTPQGWICSRLIASTLTLIESRGSGCRSLCRVSDAGRAPRDASWASIRHELFDLWAAGQVGLVFAHSPVSWRGGDEPTMAHPMFVT